MTTQYCCQAFFDQKKKRIRSLLDLLSLTEGNPRRTQDAYRTRHSGVVQAWNKPNYTAIGHWLDQGNM